MNSKPYTRALRWSSRHPSEVLSLLMVIALHAIALMTILQLKTVAQAPMLDVLSIQMLRVSPPVDAPIKPIPPKPAPVQKQPPKPAIKRITTTEPVAAPKPVVLPEPISEPPVEAPPKLVPEPPALAPAVVPPRFDAAYLNNPTPSYPALSRRNGETGRVLLRVQVGADGLPKNISIAESSNFSRLDEAAIAAVKRWRFIPAKQGDTAITESVLVPLNFQLTR